MKTQFRHHPVAFVAVPLLFHSRLSSRLILSWALALIASFASSVLTQAATVTLTLNVHSGSATGPLLSEARVTGKDAAGKSFDKTTGAGGSVVVTGTSGMWSFTVSKSGYKSVSWDQSTTATVTRHAFMMPTPPPRPTPPTGVAASDGTFTDKVQVTWNAVANAATYEVWRHTGNSSGSATRIVQNRTTTSYDDTGATAGTTYYYWVKAVNAGGTSDFSASNSGSRSNIGLQDPARYARHVDAPLQNDAANRKVTTYASVIDQFDVQYNPRYAIYHNTHGTITTTDDTDDTYCNIFVWDVTRAMGAEIPHWVDSNGQPIPDRRGQPGDHEVSATEMLDWLKKHGGSFGWTKITTASSAQSLANAGKPVIVIGTLAPSNSHVAIVRPGQEDPQKGPATAQAGAINFNIGNVSKGFGNTYAKYVEYWGHP